MTRGVRGITPPSDATVAETLATNPGSCRAAGLVTRCLRTITQVLETLDSGSGAQVELPSVPGAGHPARQWGDRLGLWVAPGLYEERKRGRAILPRPSVPEGEKPSDLWLGVPWAHEASSGEEAS